MPEKWLQIGEGYPVSVPLHVIPLFPAYSNLGLEAPFLPDCCGACVFHFIAIFALVLRAVFVLVSSLELLNLSG